MHNQKIAKNIDRRFNSGLAIVLSAFERNFPQETNSDMGMKFKGLVKNTINDCVRACRDELLDSSGVDSSESAIKFSGEMAALLPKIDFIFNSNGRSMMLRTPKENSKIIHKIFEEIECGIVHYANGECNYVISGIDSLVNYAIPFFDNFPFVGNQRTCYQEWRHWVVAFYERI